MVMRPQYSPISCCLSKPTGSIQSWETQGNETTVLTDIMLLVKTNWVNERAATTPCAIMDYVKTPLLKPCKAHHTQHVRLCTDCCQHLCSIHTFTKPPLTGTVSTDNISMPHHMQHLSGNLTECFTETKKLNTSPLRKSRHTVLPLQKPTCECALGKYYIH